MHATALHWPPRSHHRPDPPIKLLSIHPASQPPSHHRSIDRSPQPSLASHTCAAIRSPPSPPFPLDRASRPASCSRGGVWCRRAMDQGEEDGDWMMEPVPGGGKKGGAMAADRKKRFSEEQIKSLESMFATQTKLEPRQKLQLARDLSLQPRQVAIWFQNKRARWKSKQLERQYAALRDDYDALLASYDQLKKDKLALLGQLEKLAEMLQERRPRGGENAGAAGEDVRSAVAAMSMKEEFVLDAGAAKLYSASDGSGGGGGGGGGGKLSLFGEDDDDAGLFLRPSSHLPPHGGGGGFTASGPAEYHHHPQQQQSFPFHSSWPSSSTEQTCSSSQWWEFESLSE